MMAYQSLLAKIMVTASRDRSAAMMRRFLDDGDVACNFDSNDDDKDDDHILHFDLRGPAASVRCQSYSSLVNNTPVPNSRVSMRKHIKK